MLLGYRTDIAELLNASDIFVLPSFREGLSVALMEAMASGMPCIASKIRGNNDILSDDYLFNPNSSKDVIEKILYVLDKDKEYIIRDNLKKIMNFDESIVIEKMKEIYSNVAVE